MKNIDKRNIDSEVHETERNVLMLLWPCVALRVGVMLLWSCVALRVGVMLLWSCVALRIGVMLLWPCVALRIGVMLLWPCVAQRIGRNTAGCREECCWVQTVGDYKNLQLSNKTRFVSLQLRNSDNNYSINIYIYIYIYICVCVCVCVCVQLDVTYCSCLFNTSLHVSGVSCPSSGDTILSGQPLW
jgi:hypothetical protein